MFIHTLVPTLTSVSPQGDGQGKLTLEPLPQNETIKDILVIMVGGSNVVRDKDRCLWEVQETNPHSFDKGSAHHFTTKNVARSNRKSVKSCPYQLLSHALA